MSRTTATPAEASEAASSEETANPAAAVESDEQVVQTRRTRRWRGVVAIALLSGAAGVLVIRPFLLLLAVIGVAFAAYPKLLSPPVPTLSVRRSVDVDAPEHGDIVTVTVTVENEGDRPLFDLRLVDGVPPMLSVVGGAARHASALRPGETTTFSYDVRAVYGTHRFESVTVLARDIAGAVETETTVRADEETVIECRSTIQAVPLRRQTQRRSGSLTTDQGGSGVEFHRTREYVSGDPMNRIDWQRLAKTGELSTIEFRQERTASVVICVDTRAAAYRASGPEEPHAVSYGLAAAEQLSRTLLEDGYAVGLAALGPEPCWVPPGRGDGHDIALQRALSNHPGLSVRPPQNGHRIEAKPEIANGPGRPSEQTEAVTDASEAVDDQLRPLRRRLGGSSQVFFVTPLAEDGSVRAATTLERSGHTVTVVSPDVTTEESVGAQLAGVERRNRMSALRRNGIPVADWRPPERLGTALRRLGERQGGGG